jgi:hypothetical protein
MENLIRMHLELFSKNARKKQDEASETRKFASIVDTGHKESFQTTSQSNTDLAQRHLGGVTTASKVNLKFLFVPN